MNLFSRLPPRLFAPLASKNRDIYIDALFVVLSLFDSQATIRREELASAIGYALSERLDSSTFDEEDDWDEADAPSLTNKIQAIIRYLISTGWIRSDRAVNPFDETIQVPDYTVTILRTLRELVEGRKVEYSRYVYSTYSNLIAAHDNPDFMLTALDNAWETTKKFREELNILLMNIGDYIDSNTRLENVNDILKEHFDEYIVNISQKILAPIRTIDSVPRFRHQIISEVRRMEDDEEIFEALVARQGGERESAEIAIREKIHFIIDIYSTIGSTLQAIDEKNSAYVRSSIERIRYLMSSDRGSHGRLITVLKHSGDEKIAEAMADAINLTHPNLVDDASFFDRIVRTVREDGERQNIKHHSGNPELEQSMLEELRNQYSGERIDSFILSRMGNEDTLPSTMIEIKSSEDFILFLLATIRGKEEKAPFSTVFVEGEEKRGSIVLANCIFEKRKD